MAKKQTPAKRPRRMLTAEERAFNRQADRIERMASGRGNNANFTTGGRTTFDELRRSDEEVKNTGKPKYKKELEVMLDAQKSGKNVATYTSTKSGLLSIDGKTTKGAVTQSLTPKNDDGTPVIGKNGKARQAGRSEVATRRQRDYDNRKAMNNITARTVQRWRDLGWVRDVNGSIVGDGENVRGIAIHQKADGNYSMGLTTG